jgi:hypothetical protein
MVAKIEIIIYLWSKIKMKKKWTVTIKLKNKGKELKPILTIYFSGIKACLIL